MFDNMRPGDWIVIAFGIVGLGRWGVETVAKIWHRGQEHDEELEKRVNRYRSDFLTHEARDETEFKWIKQAVERMDRKLDNLQAQMRHVATGTSGFFKKEGE